MFNRGYWTETHVEKASIRFAQGISLQAALCQLNVAFEQDIDVLGYHWIAIYDIIEEIFDFIYEFNNLVDIIYCLIWYVIDIDDNINCFDLIYDLIWYVIVLDDNNDQIIDIDDVTIDYLFTR